MLACGVDRCYSRYIFFHVASTMVKASRNLKVKEWQHCVAHATNLLLMTDSIPQVSIGAIIRQCNVIVTTLHFKCDLLEREVKNTNNEIAAAARVLLQKVREVQEVEDWHH